jgi:maltooligosyltrehalose trehalohydrolase
LTLWAPRADRVEVVVGDACTELRPAGDGWHVLDDGLAPGTDYGFSLDGGDPLPDPRSPWQPAGVHGPSRTVDHGAFEWSDEAWRGFHLPGSVLYELHIGTFTPGGTFDAAIERLDHLVELGVDAVEVMPIAAFDGDRGWGYDGVALFAPHAVYGGPDGFRRFVDAAHARGLGVVLDVVYNHLGPVGNHLAKFGPYFSDRHSTPWGDAVNLDGPDSGPVRRFFVDNARAWLEHYHVDGLRLDAVHALVDHSAYHFLEELQAEVDALAAHLGRSLWLIAESDRNDPRVVLPPEAGGYGLAAQWSDDFHHALHVALTGEKDGYYGDYRGLADLAAALERPFVLDGRDSAFRRRPHGRPAGDIDGHRFVVCAQNHDQVGNRALGERLSQLVDPPLLEIAAALVLCSRYTPMLFQGEEWGASRPFQYFAGFEDPELARAVSEGRRSEFGAFDWRDDDLPDPMDPATFDRSNLDWDERAADRHARLLSWHRALLALRRARPDLTDGRADRASAYYDEAGSWLALHRAHTTVAVNLGHAERLVPAPVADGWQVLLANAAGARVTSGGLVTPPRAVVIAGVSR